MPYDSRRPNRLLTLQMGDTVTDQMVFPAYSALGEECDDIIVVLKLTTHLGNNVGVLVGLTEGSKSRLAEALTTVISVDNVRALVIMGELGVTKKCAR